MARIDGAIKPKEGHCGPSFQASQSQRRVASRLCANLTPRSFFYIWTFDGPDDLGIVLRVGHLSLCLREERYLPAST